MTRTAAPSQGFSRGFWGVILLMAATVLLALAVAALRGPARHAVEVEPDALQVILSDAAAETVDKVRAEHLAPALDRVFAPVHAAIPAYADFHYSVLGEYTELANAALGQASAAILEKMFAGFETRLQAELTGLDQTLGEIYATALQARLDALRATLNAPDLDFGPLTQAAIAEAQDRFKVTLPVNLVATTAVAAGVAKTASAVVAKKLAAKVAAKSAAKAAGKMGAVLAGAGTGALACSWAGPAAVLCGAAGGVVTFIAVDSAVVRIDAYFNRADFERDLAEMVDALRADIEAKALAALQQKAAAFDGATATLREQAGARP